jgi:hypothetical protein
MNYKVISHWKLAEFEKLVEEWLEAGWTLAGGMAVSKENGSEVFYQALVKVL